MCEVPLIQFSQDF